VVEVKVEVVEVKVEVVASQVQAEANREVVEVNQASELLRLAAVDKRLVDRLAEELGLLVPAGSA
jgi:hypothetical protein